MHPFATLKKDYAKLDSSATISHKPSKNSNETDPIPIEKIRINQILNGQFPL